MSRTSIIPQALISSALRTIGLCLLVEGLVTLALSYTPWATGQIALAVKAFDSTGYFGGITIALLSLRILPGLLLLYASRSIASLLTGEESDKELFEAQENAFFCVGIAVFGVWKLISGLSYVASIIVLNIWKIFGEPGYSLSSSTGIVGVTNFLIGITIVFLFRMLAKKTGAET